MKDGWMVLGSLTQPQANLTTFRHEIIHTSTEGELCTQTQRRENSSIRTSERVQTQRRSVGLVFD